MKSIIVKKPGGYEQLKLVDINIPKLKEGELLIKVHSAAVNRTDIITREGNVGYLENPILGVEVAGVVTEINGKSSFSIGDRVMGLVNGGGYAEFAVMPSDRAIKVPDALSFDEAAAIQLAKHISDAKVIVTAGSKRKLDFCKELGADVLINYKEQSFDEEVLKATNGQGVDLILDFVGAHYWNKNLASIKKEGRWVLSSL